MGYLTNFIVYTLAMIGVISITLMVFKGSTGIGTNKNSRYLEVHDTLSLGPRKTLYIVSAGEEKFLIASDVDKTSLISKLNFEQKQEVKISKTEEIKNNIDILFDKNKYMDIKNIGITTVQNKPYNSVMKNLAERIKG